MWCWTDVNCLQILWPIEIHLSCPFNTSPCIYIWKPLESIQKHRRVLRMENQSETVIMAKTAPGGCAFTTLSQASEFQSQKLQLWSTRMSYWSVPSICNEPLMWFSIAERICQVEGRRCKHNLFFFTPRYEILSGVFTIAVCSTVGIWQLLKHWAEAGTQTNRGLQEKLGEGGGDFLPKKLKSAPC